MKPYIRWIIFITIVSTLVFIPQLIHSQNNKDIALIMDSSGSMKKTDPHSLRIPAAKLFISLLHKGDRAAVMSFSDKGYPIRYLTPIETKADKEKLFKAVDKISSKGLYTNLHDAFYAGGNLLTRDKQEEREQIMILMSDGMMDVGNPEEDSILLDKLNTETTKDLKDKNIKVFAIAFTDQSDKTLLEKISKKTGGFFNLALTDKDFHVIFTSIFESLKSPDMLPMEANGFTVDSSIKEVTIVATKGSPETEIRINAPDGQSYSNRKKYSGIGWFESDNFDMITVERPVEGRWEILFSTGENNKAYVITNLSLKSNFDSLHSLFGKPFELQFWLEKDGKTITSQEILDKIEMFIELTGPDDKITKLVPFNKGEGIYQRNIAAFTPGNYSMRIVAKGMTFEREKNFVFSVANVKESMADIKERAAEKTLDNQSDKETNEITEEEEISWPKFIFKFLAFNIILAILVLLYMKRSSLKNFMNRRKESQMKYEKIDEDAEGEADNIAEEVTQANPVNDETEEEPTNQKEPKNAIELSELEKNGSIIPDPHPDEKIDHEEIVQEEIKPETYNNEEEERNAIELKDDTKEKPDTDDRKEEVEQASTEQVENRDIVKESAEQQIDELLDLDDGATTADDRKEEVEQASTEQAENPEIVEESTQQQIDELLDLDDGATTADDRKEEIEQASTEQTENPEIVEESTQQQIDDALNVNDTKTDKDDSEDEVELVSAERSESTETDKEAKDTQYGDVLSMEDVNALIENNTVDKSIKQDEDTKKEGAGESA